MESLIHKNQNSARDQPIAPIICSQPYTGAIENFYTVSNGSKIELDAYLEEELYDLITYCIQNSGALDYSTKENRIKGIGQELFADGGVDALENMYFSIEHRVKEEISKDAKPYRSLWNDISSEWNY
ncbi:MAG: hypothetical protein ACYC6W_09060 [Nitrosotalea sp.]